MAIESHEITEKTIQVPAPTAWPFTLSLGLTLVFAGLVTGPSISLLGALLAVVGAYGWFRDVLPAEAEEAVPVIEGEAFAAATQRAEVARIHIAPETPRAFLPLETYPVSAGIKGGLAGAVAMAVLAMLYGIVSGNGIWYPINLLAAGFLPANLQSTAEIAKFNLTIFLIASAIHLITSLLVGLLYGAMLPMLPRRPILLGGFIAPIMWSALLYSILDVVNPVLSQRIHWGWFVLSQFGFGIVAGIVVSRQERVPTSQPLPLAVRLGIETPGLSGEKRGPEQER